jgi:hypothetical protein
MSKYRWTGYVIEDKIVIKDEKDILMGYFQMGKGLPAAKGWADWITFCLNYWEENYKGVEVTFADEWFQVKEIT